MTGLIHCATKTCSQNAVETQADIVAAGFIVNKETAQPLVRKITEINHTEDNVECVKKLLVRNFRCACM